jgi:HEAT repeat protein
VRRSAAVTIGLLARPEDAFALDALGKAVAEDTDKIVGHFSILSIGQLGGAGALEALKKGHERANKETRGFYLLALGMTRQPEAAGVIAKVLEESADANDAAAAAVALGLLGDGAQAPHLRKRMALAKDWLLLQTTSLSLGILNDRVSAEPIKTLLVEKRQPALRTAAALAYALIQQHSAIPLLIEMLESSGNVVTQKALTQVLAYLPSRQAAEPLLETFRNTKLQRDVRAYALVALGTIADRSHFPLFLSLGFDTNYFVRCDPLDEAFTIL